MRNGVLGGSAVRLRIMGKLQTKKPAVSAALRQQGLVPSRFYDPSILNDMNTISVCDRVEPMRDDQCRLSCAKLTQCLLHLALGFAVERCGTLVQQHDGGILDYGTGDDHSLAFAH